MEVLRRRCPLAIAQRLVHCAAAVSTAVLGQSQRQCPLHCCWWTTRSERSPIFTAQLHLPTHDLFWANLKVQLHLPPLRSLDLLISPGNLNSNKTRHVIYSRQQSLLQRQIKPQSFELRRNSFFVPGVDATKEDVKILSFPMSEAWSAVSGLHSQRIEWESLLSQLPCGHSDETVS